jgi:hypothetical protein
VCYSAYLNLSTIMAQFKVMPGLPAPLEAALKGAQYEYSKDRKEFLDGLKGQYDVEFSVTDLTRPVKQVWLGRKFSDDLVIDLVKDNFYSLLGSVTHWILQRYAPPHCVVESREYVILNIQGLRVLIHGQNDLYDPYTFTLDDYKVTSGWSWLYEKSEYEFQLNANKYIRDTRHPGQSIKNIRNIYLFRHLDKAAQERNPEYPTSNIQIKVFKPWERSVTEAKIRELAIKKLAHMKTKWQSLPDCTDEERWIRDSRWSVYFRKKQAKKGEIPDFSSKTSHHFDSAEGAAEFIASATEETKLVKRTGEPKRCMEFCAVAPFCKQFQDELKSKQQENEQSILDD